MLLLNACGKGVTMHELECSIDYHEQLKLTEKKSGKISYFKTENHSHCLHSFTEDALKSANLSFHHIDNMSYQTTTFTNGEETTKFIKTKAHIDLDSMEFKTVDDLPNCCVKGISKFEVEKIANKNDTLFYIIQCEFEINLTGNASISSNSKQLRYVIQKEILDSYSGSTELSVGI